MKTPVRINYSFPARFNATNEPYEIDWSDLLEDGETMTGAIVAVILGDTIADTTLVRTDDTSTTFWLSGGAGAPRLHKVQVTFTSSKGETDAMTIAVPVIG